MDTLRTEIIETQKTRSDLLKWKLLVVAGIGSAALGFSGSNSDTLSNAHLALAVIPVACFYVDLLCRHLSLRNKTIGRFIASHDEADPALRAYERYYHQRSTKEWEGSSLESVALVGCTLFLSVAIIPVGILASGDSPRWGIADWPASLFYGAGASGVALSIWLQLKYSRWKSQGPEITDTATKSGSN